MTCTHTDGCMCAGVGVGVGVCVCTLCTHERTHAKTSVTQVRTPINYEVGARHWLAKAGHLEIQDYTTMSGLVNV